MTVLLILISLSIIIIPEKLREKEILKVGEVKQLSSEDSTIIQNLNVIPEVSPKINGNMNNNISIDADPDKNNKIIGEKNDSKEEKIV